MTGNEDNEILIDETDFNERKKKLWEYVQEQNKKHQADAEKKT